jgi:hypothetical protein
MKLKPLYKLRKLSYKALYNYANELDIFWEQYDRGIGKILDEKRKDKKLDNFENVPSWVKKGQRVSCFYNGRWMDGVIKSTAEDNDRGIEITTDKLTDAGSKYLSIPVYMTSRSDKEWSNLLKRKK